MKNYSKGVLIFLEDVLIFLAYWRERYIYSASKKPERTIAVVLFMSALIGFPIYYFPLIGSTVLSCCLIIIGTVLASLYFIVVPLMARKYISLAATNSFQRTGLLFSVLDYEGKAIKLEKGCMGKGIVYDIKFSEKSNLITEKETMSLWAEDIAATYEITVVYEKINDFDDADVLTIAKKAKEFMHEGRVSFWISCHLRCCIRENIWKYQAGANEQLGLCLKKIQPIDSVTDYIFEALTTDLKPLFSNLKIKDLSVVLQNKQIVQMEKSARAESFI